MPPIPLYYRGLYIFPDFSRFSMNYFKQFRRTSSGKGFFDVGMAPILTPDLGRFWSPITCITAQNGQNRRLTGIFRAPLRLRHVDLPRFKIRVRCLRTWVPCRHTCCALKNKVGCPSVYPKRILTYRNLQAINPTDRFVVFSFVVFKYLHQP
jgi:hypothetical protein